MSTARMSKTRQWTALAVVAALSVLVGGWVLVVAPHRAAAAEVALAVEGERAAVASLAVQLQVLRAQADELPATRARLAELEGAIPATVDLPGLVTRLTAAADDTGVELVSVSPGAPVPGPSYSSVPVVLVVEATYFSAEQFLHALETLPRELVVGSLTLAADAGTGTGTGVDRDRDRGRLTLTVNGTVFTREGATPAAAGAVPGAAGAATAPAPAAAPPDPEGLPS